MTANITSLTDRLGPHARPDARRAASTASLDLHNACTAAGLSLSALPSTERPGQVDIGWVAPETADELTRLIRRSIKQALRASERLRAAFHARALDIPDPYVRHGRIELGQLPLAAADRLTGLLGGPLPDPDVELSYWPEAQLLIARLCKAFKQATRGGFLDPQFHPDCLHCNAEALLALGSIPVATARRLADALESHPEPA
ncbi:hypothetical protein [Streptomyces flavofungini]|uniref:hypothetical protein n=1 Tax=Streptomyces flavofungini TaxID=68200 RepID=UPI0025B10D3A|nr:hypothetical protein [Streptomyces flavofungini]WJV48887.1 hypothetical protein QUY26_27270 [Streptomyces flavofungini]